MVSTEGWPTLSHFSGTAFHLCFVCMSLQLEFGAKGVAALLTPAARTKSTESQK